jgi:hypothetical protein
MLRPSLAGLIAALLGFPVGALTSIALETSGVVPFRAGEYAGFTVFGILEGIAAALGFLAWRADGAKSKLDRWLAGVAMILGAIGVVIVLLLYARGALK